MENNQNSDVQSQPPLTIFPNCSNIDDDQELENLEIEEQKQYFSQLFEELCAYSINPQEEVFIDKKRTNKFSQFRRGSYKIMKKQQERKRKQQIIEQLLQKQQKTDFIEFKQKECKDKCISEEMQVQQGEWQGDHCIQVQEHDVIPLGYVIDGQDLMLLNESACNVNNNDNCFQLNNNNEINNNQLLMNAFEIPLALALRLPNL
ncbi:unnamed protein product (macronuclear) [Paramecium tetraurelia]|uniref:CCT domain-containing protein n=1 Tax=Paramecium tetraurelia TaxID=5888 RepID=A0BL50_PARTE|nr:uncharacterized protein GSPATT00029898001 [Paramecium tetraurelia]CAK59267.1 unnamed protein product [Paramecium tetraurelia]|eukprot:XP_001426665.1 hypothetical protein (macronuclear) [Paramecium tetraurelia strain d4-2]